MDYIAEPLRSLAVPIAELHEDPSNARKGHAVERIAASLKQYGQRKPIVVNRAQGGKVEAGNGTLAAAKSLGWTHIAAVFVNDDAATAAAYGIADNRVGEFSEWDADILGDLIPTLDGLFTGFLPAELDAILPQQHTEGDTEPQVDRADELRQKWGVESGQMWRLGEHRIICGDCTDVEVVARVMGGERASLLVTSPPYGVGKEYESGGLQQWRTTVGGMLTAAKTITDAAALNLGDVKVGPNHREVHTYGVLIDLCASAGFSLIGTRVWSKGAAWAGQGPYWLSSYRAVDDFEYIGLFGVIPHSDRSHADWRYRGVWDIASVRSNKLHSAMFPVELPARLVELLCEPNAIIYEPFSGSGTTIIACENLGRRCRAVEISAGYVAVAIERWATHTGGTPELIP